MLRVDDLPLRLAAFTQIDDQAETRIVVELRARIEIDVVERPAEAESTVGSQLEFSRRRLGQRVGRQQEGESGIEELADRIRVSRSPTAG